LRTKGSLHVKKSVGRVFLYAEKDIVLSGGVMGKNGGFIEAGCDIYAKFVEQGKLKAGGSIRITEASLHSDLTAKDAIIIYGGRGELIGGEAVAGNYVSVSKLGAVVETKTNLIVGLPPDMLDELQRMKEELVNREDTLKKIKFSMNKILDISSGKKEKELNKEEQETILKLQELEKKYLDLYNSLKTQYESIMNSYDISENAYVEVEKNIFPRVNISFGKGKAFNSELRPVNTKCYVYVAADGLVTATNIPPKSFHKKEDKS
jgi:uncharacterized protein (DUF342 family)